MTWTFYLDGTALAAERVTLDSATGLSEAAELGVVAHSGITIDDPDGDLDIRGWQEFYAVEGSATPQRLFTGYVSDQTVTRGPWHVGVERQWNVSLVDLNTLLHMRVFRGADANRPDESEQARMNWLLGTAYGCLSGILDGTSYVTTGTVLGFTPADYRGQYAGDVLAEMAAASYPAKTYYVFWDTATGTPTLYYDYMTASNRTASQAISNDVSEWDGTAVLAPNYDAELRIDPSETYSGVLLRWRGNDVWDENAATGSAYIFRDMVYANDHIGKPTTATTIAANLVDDVNDAQKTRATVTVEVDDETVNDILPGQLLNLHMTHWPGFTTALSGTPATQRVVHRTVNRHPNPRPDKYLVRLELTEALPKAVGVGGGPFPYDEEVPCVDTGDDPMLTATVTAFQTGGVSAPANPENVNDGEDSTLSIASSGVKGSGTYSRGWIADLGEAATVSALRFWSTSGGFWTYGTPELYYSTVGTGGPWTFHSDSGDWTMPPGNEVTYTFPVGIEARYWKASVTWTQGLAYYPYHRLGTWAFVGCAPGDAEPPRSGAWVYGDIPTPTPDGTTQDFTTTWPFADGTLEVFVDRLNQTAAVADQDAGAGTFTLAFAPKVGELVEVNYQGR